jgi:protein-L-isoaspartate(D-aspartate) O-methyltransferase
MNAETTRKIRLIMNLRNSGITNTDVLAAIEKVPREEFVLPAMIDQAYEDIALPIGRGQTISQPLVVATMTEALHLDNRCKVLEIGTGSGYQACVLSHLCRRVYTIERHKLLLEKAEEMFKKLRLHNITSIAADGMKGWPRSEQAPFDRIIVTAAARGDVPKALLDQLKVGGILVIPVGQDSSSQVLKSYKKESDDTYAIKEIMPVRFVPLLPDLASEDDIDEINNKVKAY